MPLWHSPPAVEHENRPLKAVGAAGRAEGVQTGGPLCIDLRIRHLDLQRGAEGPEGPLEDDL